MIGRDWKEKTENEAKIDVFSPESCWNKTLCSAELNVLLSRVRKEVREQKYNSFAQQQLIAFSDANHGESRVDGKSNSGVICFINGAPIVWKTRKQSLVAQSTCEAEYYAICETTKEVLWLRRLLRSFILFCNSPTVFLADNQSSISLIENNEFMQRTKYIAIRCHFIRDLIQKGSIELKYCPSEYNTADMMTKPLNGPKIEEHRVAACLMPPKAFPTCKTNKIITLDYCT